MDAKLIEQLDRRRYKYLLWQTIGFAMFIPGVIIGPYLTCKAAIIVMTLITVSGVGLFIVPSLMSNRNERQIKSDPALRAALNNELVVFYGYKSLKWAFFATLITAAVLYCLSYWWLTAITAPIVCLVIIYVVCLTLKIAQLVYMRK